MVRNDISAYNVTEMLKEIKFQHYTIQCEINDSNFAGATNKIRELKNKVDNLYEYVNQK